jgi:hypothetical protein
MARYTVARLTLVPHANDIAVAATTDTTLAVLSLLSAIAAGQPDKNVEGAIWPSSGHSEGAMRICE